MLAKTEPVATFWTHPYALTLYPAPVSTVLRGAPHPAAKLQYFAMASRALVALTTALLRTTGITRAALHLLHLLLNP
jgi:hypothetical protein